MIKFFKILLVLLAVTQVNAQELSATITINSDKISGSNKQVFSTLERSLTEFVNQKKWTNKKFKPQEKIQCAFVLTITEQLASNSFKGTLQVQSSRPVYDAIYQTPVFNFKDVNFSFQYTEYETLEYNLNDFDSDLVSTMAFYVYTILGMDADTFQKNGGDSYFKQAENVVNQAQQGGNEGWDRKTRGATRFRLINDILSDTFSAYREVTYNYHRQGLDLFSSKKEEAKENIAASISLLKTIYNRRPNALLVRIFMDAKSDEIQAVFSDGPRFDVSNLKEELNKMSPTNASKWSKIK